MQMYVYFDFDMDSDDIAYIRDLTRNKRYLVEIFEPADRCFEHDIWGAYIKNDKGAHLFIIEEGCGHLSADYSANKCWHLVNENGEPCDKYGDVIRD